MKQMNHCENKRISKNKRRMKQHKTNASSKIKTIKLKQYIAWSYL